MCFLLCHHAKKKNAASRNVASLHLQYFSKMAILVCNHECENIVCMYVLVSYANVIVSVFVLAVS